MRLIFFFLLATFSSLWIGCSQSDDGPISLYPGGLDVGGNGYVLAATLDSGNRFHLLGDTLVLHLDSMWTLTNCLLSNIEVNDSLVDSVLTLSIKLVLSAREESDCPAPFFRPDTTLHLPIKEEWKRAREIRVEGNAVNELFKDTSAAAAATTFKDSILLRSGSFSLDTIVTYLDSSFKDYHYFPRRAGVNVGVLLLVDSIHETSYAWQSMTSHCKKVHDACDVVPDTLWPSSWLAKDTALVPLRVTCVNDSTVYCLNADWVNDSTNLSEEVYEHKDTTWYVSSYYLEKIPECASLNRGNFSASLHPGYSSKFSRELYIPAKSESSCGPAGLPKWLAINLSTQKEILDSATTTALVEQWYLATVGDEL